MKVEITRPFVYAHGGIRLEEIAPGAVVEGDCAVQALAGGWGRDVEAAPAEPEQAALEASPENAAMPRAPRRKAR